MAQHDEQTKNTLAGLCPKVYNNGPSFLYYLIHNYANTTPHIIRSIQNEINEHYKKISRVLKWNVDKFYTYTTSQLLQMSENGGNDEKSFDNVYKILTRTPCPTFNSEIVVFKQLNISNIDVWLILVKASEEYRTLVAEGTWCKRQNNNKEHNQHTKRTELRHSDLAALISLSLSGKNKIKVLRA